MHELELAAYNSLVHLQSIFNLTIFTLTTMSLPLNFGIETAKRDVSLWISVHRCCNDD
jgi:hypothetical protein